MNDNDIILHLLVQPDQKATAQSILTTKGGDTDTLEGVTEQLNTMSEMGDALTMADGFYTLSGDGVALGVGKDTSNDVVEAILVASKAAEEAEEFAMFLEKLLGGFSNVQEITDAVAYSNATNRRIVHHSGSDANGVEYKQAIILAHVMDTVGAMTTKKMLEAGVLEQESPEAVKTPTESNGLDAAFTQPEAN